MTKREVVIMSNKMDAGEQFPSIVLNIGSDQKILVPLVSSHGGIKPLIWNKHEKGCYWLVVYSDDFPPLGCTLVKQSK